MAIGIIGAGGIGMALALQFSRAQVRTCISNSRGPDSLAANVAALGATATASSVAEAAAHRHPVVYPDDGSC